MKRVFSNQTKALSVPFSLALALSLALGATSTSPAGVKSMWNPMHWGNSSQAANVQSSDTAVTDARRKAEAAQQAANQAMQDAQRALEKATEARRQAEALEKSIPQTAASTHPVVIAPQQPEAQDDIVSGHSASTDEKAQRVYQAPTQNFASNRQTATSTGATKREPWNPLGWFHNEDKATGLDGSIPQEKTGESSQDKQVEHQPDAPSAPEQHALDFHKTEEASTQEHGGWSLKNLFTKPTPATGTTTASTQETTNTAQSQPETAKPAIAEKTADKATEATDETSTASTAGKGGWNLLNLLSKPGHSQDSQGVNQQALQAEKTPKAEAGETDQSPKSKAALIETEKGNIAIEFYPDQAPLTVANFVKLINEGFYNRYNMKFHRVVPGFVIQTGDPTGTGAGGSKDRVPLEAKNKLSHNAKGVVAMARGADPNSATSQFYITLAPQLALDGKYAVFGKVISGMDVLSKIEKDDMLYGIRLVDLSAVVRDPQPEKKKFFSSLF